MSCWSELAEPLQAVLTELCQKNGLQMITSSVGELDRKNIFLVYFFSTADFYEQKDLLGQLLCASIVLIAPKREPRTSPLDDERLMGVRFLISSADVGIFERITTGIIALGMHNLPCLSSFMPQQESFDTLHKQMFDSKSKSDLYTNAVDFFEFQRQKHESILAPGLSNLPKILADMLDELLMNAFWDASPERRALDRSQHLKADDGIDIVFFANTQFFGMSVTDNHGTFPESGVLKPVRFALGVVQETVLSEGTAGAGLGLMMVLQKAPIMFFEVIANSSTKVTIVFPLNESQKETQRKPRNLLFSFQ